MKRYLDYLKPLPFDKQVAKHLVKAGDNNAVGRYVQATTHACSPTNMKRVSRSHQNVTLKCKGCGMKTTLPLDSDLYKEYLRIQEKKEGIPYETDDSDTDREVHQEV